MSEPASTIYTKTGDDGTTGRLFGGRITKDDLLIEACGDVDETVAALGVAREALKENPELSELVLGLQRHLFVVAADLSANPRARHLLTQEVSLVVPTMTDDLERTIDGLTARKPLRPVFIVPGASRASASLDLARTVARRTERHVIRVRAAGRAVSPEVVAYLNRLSDLLYVLARRAAGAAEEPVSHR
ncbi:MAG: cob(I)yrinic acid a,c-diamide adenosyltransferase [Actinomycetota bacterium]